MSEIDQFFRQAGKIHDMHIEKLNNADMEIAEKRIKQYFDGELNLSWKSILYEINKLPELQRNKYFKNLVEQEKQKSINEIKESLKGMTFIRKVKFISNIRKDI